MSFSDAMSSVRGPGLIGMVMALFVLLGFGVLFTFAFDEGLQGGDQSIESIIRHQGDELTYLTANTKERRELLGEEPGRQEAAYSLSLKNRENRGLNERSTGLQIAIDAAKADMARRTEVFKNYKDEYRALVRGKAKGSELEVLETTNGEVYKSVTIREVTAVGIQIRHQDGQKRIAFENLPDSMKDYYQFDPVQKRESLAKENQLQIEHEAAVLQANDRVEAQMARQKGNDAKLAKDKLVLAIAAKETQINSLRTEINRLESDREQAAAAANAARSAGRTHINKANTFESQIRNRQSRVRLLSAEINQMKSSL